LLNLAELIDGRAGDLAVKVEEQGEVLQLLADDETEGSEHGHTSVGDLALAPAANIANGSAGGQAQGVPGAIKGATPAGQGQQV